VHEKIAECEKRYFAQGVPAIFKITDGVDIEFDKLLEKQGYEIVTPTYLMTRDMNDFQITSGECVMTSYIGNDWMESYFTLNKYTDEMKKNIARQIYGNIKVDVFCAKIMNNKTAVACGLCVIERGYAGLFNIVVDESHRGKGHGKKICVLLLSAAKRLGAHTAYLQVIQENHIAVNLYTKLGYKKLYSYWYRAKKGDNITIRFAVPADAPDMAEAHMRSWEVAYKDIIPQEYIRERNATRPAMWEKTLAEGQYPHRVIQQNGKTVGNMCVAPPQDDDLDDNYYEMHCIFLHPDYFRQGIGTKAMAFAFDIARNLGKKVMTVWVFAENISSIKFYEKCGFEPDGKTKILHFGKPLTAIRMKREL
jgi:ribosomal protein S18 acetylase RimI-like enzyme